MRLAELSMVLALDLFEAIAHAVKKTLVGGQYLPVQVELDDCRGAQQGANQALVFAGGRNGAGQVGGKAGEVEQFAAAIQHRLPDGPQPGLLVVATQQAKGTT